MAMSEDPVLGELLAHYGLEAFESMLAADKFGIDNLLHVQTEKEFDGFFEHFGVTGFLHQNRFKTMIAAIPGLKRTNRLPSEIGRSMHMEVSQRARPFPTASPMQQMVSYTNPAMASPMYGMNPMMMNPMMNMPWMSAGMVPPAAAAPMARAVSMAPSAAPKKKNVVIAPIKLQPSADDAGEEESLFDTDEATEAVQFGMVKPWVGTVAALTPDNAPKNNALAPDARLQLEWVYGLKSDETRQHVHLDSSNRIIFPAAAVLVAYDAQAHTQAHFFGPTDEITCVAQDPTNANVYVVGQGAAIVDKRSSDPFLSIIDVGSGDVSTLPKRHKKGICSVAVSADGSMAASCGLDDNFNIIVWDLKGRDAIAQEKAMNKTKVLHMAWSTVSPNEFCAVGQDTVAFYSLEGRKLTVTGANFNGNQKQLFTCVAYTKKGTCIVGAKDGSVYAFGEQTCKKVFPVHNSVVTTILPFDGGVITAAAGQIRINNSKLEQLKSFDTGDAFARSVCVRNSTLVVATNHGDLLVIGDMSKNELPEIVHSAHHDGELYAVAPHPDASSGVFASVGEDNKLIAWNAKQRSATKVAVITTEESKRGKVIVRAATTSTHGTNQCARSIAFSPNGSHLAVGTNEGKVNVYDARSFALITSVDCNSYGKANAKNPEHWIQALSYNPAGTCLAVGTHGSVIVLLDVAKGYAFAEKLTSHNAAVTALDWTTDGKFIASICRGYELLFHSILPGFKGSARANAPLLKNVQWATTTCKFGWAVNGVFRPDQNGGSIQSINVSNSKDLIVTGEDTKSINLWRYPCNVEGNAFTSFGGHSSFVTAVRFMPDDQRLLSTGGNDKCIFQWVVKRQ